MYPQRTVYPFQYGLPQIPQRQMSAYSPGTVATGPGPQQPQSGGLLSSLAPMAGTLALNRAMSSPAGLSDSQMFDMGLKDNFGLDATNGITDLDRAQFADTLGGTYPGFYAGPQGAAAAVDAADASSPYAANALLANGADPEIMAQLAAEGGTTADLGLGAGAATGAGAAAGAGAAGTAAAGGAAAGATEGAAAAGAADAGLLGMGALGPIALGGLGIYGLGSLLDWW